MLNSPGLGPERVRSQTFGKGTMSKNFCNYLSFFLSDSINKLTIFQTSIQKFAGPWLRACQIIDFWKGTISNNFCNFTCLFCFRFHQQINNFPEIYLEITNSRTTAQKWTQKWAPVLVSCSDNSDNCFLFRKPRTRGGLSGSPGPWP